MAFDGLTTPGTGQWTGVVGPNDFHINNECYHLYAA